MEAGRLVSKAICSSSTTVVVMEMERILDILRETSGFGLQAVNGTFRVISSCVKLFPKTAATKFYMSFIHFSHQEMGFISSAVG